MRAAWLRDEQAYRAKIQATAFFVAYQPNDGIVRRMIDALCIYRAKLDSAQGQRRDLARDAKNQLRDLQRACENLLEPLDKVIANPTLAGDAQAVGLPALGIEILNLQETIAKLREKRFVNLSQQVQEKVARERLVASLQDAVSQITASRQQQADIVREILALTEGEATHNPKEPSFLDEGGPSNQP